MCPEKTYREHRPGLRLREQVVPSLQDPYERSALVVLEPALIFCVLQASPIFGRRRLVDHQVVVLLDLDPDRLERSSVLHEPARGFLGTGVRTSSEFHRRGITTSIPH